MHDTVIIESNPGRKPAAYLIHSNQENFDAMAAIAAAAKEFAQTPKGQSIVIGLNGTLPMGDFDLHVPAYICKNHGFSLMQTDIEHVPFGWDTLSGSKPETDIFVFLTDSEYSRLQFICDDENFTGETLAVQTDTELGHLEITVSQANASPSGLLATIRILDTYNHPSQIIPTVGCGHTGCTFMFNNQVVRVRFMQDTLENHLQAAKIPFEVHNGTFHVLRSRTAYILIKQFMTDNDLPIPSELGDRTPEAYEIGGEYVFPETACNKNRTKAGDNDA